MKLKGTIPEVKMSEGRFTKIALLNIELLFDQLKPYKIIAVNTSSLFNGGAYLIPFLREVFPKKF